LEVAVSVRELVVLGTASQVPTRTRAHNGYLLRFDGVGILVDPGEGTQRQLAMAGARVSSLRHILITHAHGDHCLGLPGVLQRLSLDGVPGPVHVRFPTAADTSALDAWVGFKPATPVDEGVRRFVDWYRAYYGV
jgi:ribonuclease Z